MNNSLKQFYIFLNHFLYENALYSCVHILFNNPYRAVFSKMLAKVQYLKLICHLFLLLGMILSSILLALQFVNIDINLIQY